MGNSNSEIAEVVSIIIWPCYFIGPCLHCCFKFCIQRARNKKTDIRTKYEVNNNTIDIQPSTLNDAEKGIAHMSPAEIKSEFKKEISILRIYSAYFHVGLVAMILYLILTNTLSNSDTNSALNIFCYVSMPFSLLLIYLEAFYSYEYSYVCDLAQEISMLAYLKQLIDTQPSITMKIVCSHTTESESGTNTVVDYRQSEHFAFVRWLDTSLDPETLPLDKTKVIHMKLLKDIRLGDTYTQEAFEKQKLELIKYGKLNYPRSSVEFFRIDDIQNFKKSLALSWNPKSVKAWMKKRRYFILSSLVGCTWFYRFAFNRSTQKSAFRLQKQVYVCRT